MGMEKYLAVNGLLELDSACLYTQITRALRKSKSTNSSKQALEFFDKKAREKRGRAGIWAYASFVPGNSHA
jgi:hypothetical protein